MLVSPTTRRSASAIPYFVAATLACWSCARYPEDAPNTGGVIDPGTSAGGNAGDGSGEAGKGGQGTPEQGGNKAGQGGNPSTGGNRAGQGGNPSTGGNKAGQGGNPSTGGNRAGQGGNPSTGGNSTGGTFVNNSGLPPIQNGCSGYATRFWDCCKPHCGWSGNVSGGVKPLAGCTAANGPIDGNAGSSCNGGGSHMCYSLTPWAVNDSLAYGFAATSSGDVCGRCFQLQFTGSSHNGGNDPGSKALAGRTMVVQAINIGFDVGGGQFDLAIPGGGVGAFNACSAQWGVPANELGEQYGGFLAVCRRQGGNNHDNVKSCVLQRCMNVFQARGLNDLAAACRWSVQWLQAADNPNVKFKEIACPQAITARSGMVRNSVDNRCGN